MTALIAVDVYAAMDVGGSVRVRYEDKSDFNLSDSSQNYVLTQVRAHLNWQINDTNRFYVELQDARVVGESKTAFPPVNENARNQPFADNLDIHQLFYEWQAGSVKFKAGRQKFNLGDKRLVASLEWVNTARVHDGIRVTVAESQGRVIDVFASRLVSIQPDEINDQSESGNRYFDSGFHGAFVSDPVSLADSQLEYWYLLRKASDFNDEVHTVGARMTRAVQGWQIDLQAAIQAGDFGGLDHFAYMAHAGAKRPMFGGTFGLAYNFASGDDDPNDNNHNTFDNLYPLNHAYYGYMDLFSLQNMHNLELTYVTKPTTDTSFRVGYQGVWLAETRDAWYNAGLAGNSGRLANALLRDAAGEDVDSHVGHEIDVTLTYVVNPSWNMQAGLSRFLPGDYTSDTGTDDPANFFYFMTRVTF